MADNNDHTMRRAQRGPMADRANGSWSWCASTIMLSPQTRWPHGWDYT